jgi:hypothetical protein
MLESSPTPAWQDRLRYELLINQAHSLSGCTTREACEVLGLDSQHFEGVLSTAIKPTRDLLILLCLRCWHLDPAQADEVLATAGFRSLVSPRDGYREGKG